jgi:maltose O-acetyltransferase
MKTEKEKMLAGELYNPLVNELADDRRRTQNIIYKFNVLRPDKIKKRNKLIHKLFGSIGENFTIIPPFYCDYGWNIHVGANFYANFNCTILDVNNVSIGSNCLLAPNVQIYSATHPVEPGRRLRGNEFGRPICIGDNVWIGGGSIICPGVTIGDNVTIGAGSIVTRDIPSNVVAVGNPCRVLRKIVE